MSDLLQRILGQNWPFYTHQKLYDMVRTNAAGVSVLAEADRAWTEFTKLMLDSRRRIDGLLRIAGAAWEGVAANSMEAGVTPLAQWADDAGVAGHTSGSGLRNIGESFAHTANSMPEPVHAQVNARYANVFSGMIDRDRQERLAHEAKLRAVELMQGYSSSAHSAVSSLGVFVPPQEVTVRPGPVQLSSGGAVQDGGGEIVTRAPGGTRPPEETSSRSDPGSVAEETPATRQDSTESVTAAGAGEVEPSQSPATQAPAATTPVAAAERSAGGGLSSGTGVSTGVRGADPGDRLAERPAPGAEPGAGRVGGGRHDGGVTRASGAKIAARVGAIGTGHAVPPAAAARREEDKEHVAPDYLRGYHEEFWDGTQVGPPVIGEEPQQD